jgi:hypothetical protein
MLNKTKLTLLGIALGTVVATPSFAQDATTQAEQVLSLFSSMEQVAGPASSAGSPVGYGSGWGVIYGGASVSDRTQSSASMDGSAAIGMGLGDPHKYVGMDVAVSVISLDYTDGGFGDTGDYSFKMSRFIGDTAAVAIGVDNAFPWGDDATDSDQSWYGVISNQFSLAVTPTSKTLPLTLSLGYGTGTYQSDASSDDGVANTIGIFGSAGLQLTSQFSVIGDWTGEMINAGISVVPVKKWPLVTSLTVTDLSNRTGNKTPVVFSVGYAYSF